MKHFITFTLISLLISTKILAQISSGEQAQINQLIPQPVPKSPNVASLEKFGDYPVSYFTGLPDITVPVFEVKSGELSVPITLSYHASGIKPTDVASWVGLGWSLSAGGQVSRSVQGKPDEQYFYTGSLMQNPSICTSYNYLRNSAQGSIDTQPDVFSYSFPGGGGKFLLGQNGAPPFLFPNEPHIVSPSFATNQFTKFEVTNEHGVLHRFGTGSTGNTSMEYTTSVSGGNPSLLATTAWNLMEVVAPNTNDNITFLYQPVGTSNSKDVSYTVTVQDRCSVGIAQDQSSGLSSYCPFPYTTEATIPINTTANQEGIETITFKTGKVEFVLGGTYRLDQSQLKYLDHINIYSLVNGSYNLLKTIKFNFTYFNNASGGSTALKLDAVQFLDNLGSLVEQYKFTYSTNAFSWDPSNSNFLNARDLWGFYNGATQNTDLVPAQSVPFQQTISATPGFLNIGGATDRTPSSQYSQEGILTRIDFPTGGYSLFSYENNQFDNSGTAALAGGLRIKQVQSFDGTNPPLTKTYKYGLGESGNGLPNFSLSQYNYQNSQYVFNTDAPCDEGAAVTVYQSRTFISNSAFSYNSYPVMYPYVTEYDGDPAISTIGKTIYEFDNGAPTSDVDLLIPNSGKPYKDTFDWKRGKLSHKTVYDANNNTLAETIVTNSVLNPSDNIIGLGAYQYNANLLPVCTSDRIPTCTNEDGDQVFTNDFLFTNITQSNGAVREMQRTEYVYQTGNANSFQMKQTSNIFDLSKYQLTQRTIDRSDNNQMEVTVHKYPFQYSAANKATGNALGVAMLNQKNILSSPVETYTYLQNQDGSNARIISGQVTAFRQNANNPAYVVPDQIYIWEGATASPFSSYVTSSINTNNSGLTLDTNYNPRINFVNYDGFGNLQEVSKVNDVQISYLYGYNNALPVAEIRNAQNSLYQSNSNIQSTGAVAITMGGSTSTQTQSFNFNVDYTGTVYLRLGVAGSPSYATSVSYSGITTGSATLGTGACGATVISFSNVVPGSYAITVTITASSGTSVGACGEIDYPKIISNPNSGGIVEFFSENFEENNSSGVIKNPALAHSGNSYYSGQYTVNFTLPNSRSYVIEYFYLDNTSIWQHMSRPYTGSSATLSDGSAFDDVRIYPSDAQIKTYTYDPILGQTSLVDQAGLLKLYDYDNYGRLKRIRNYKGVIEKQYMYNYQGN